MPFQRLLKELVEAIPQAIGAVFADWEGEIVAFYSREEDSDYIKFIGAHHGILLDSAKRASLAVNAGETNFITVKTGKGCYLTAPVHDGYYLVLALKSSTYLPSTNLAVAKIIAKLRVEMGY